MVSLAFRRIMEEKGEWLGDMAYGWEGRSLVILAGQCLNMAEPLYQ